MALVPSHHPLPVVLYPTLEGRGVYMTDVHCTPSLQRTDTARQARHNLRPRGSRDTSYSGQRDPCLAPTPQP